MRAISIINNKGGVGKTTLLTNLASFFALKLQKRILVIDADPQCNTTQSMVDDSILLDLYEKKSGFTLWDVVKPLRVGKGYIDKPVFFHSSSFGVDLLPGDPRMSLAEDMLSSDWLQSTAGDIRGLRTTLLFANLLSHCADYDYVFFDMGPSLGAINRSVLLSSDFFIIPTSIDIFSLQAIKNISDSLIDWRDKFSSGLKNVEDHHELDISNPKWRLLFCGYVTQQYSYRRDASGLPRPVKAYEKIISQIPSVIQSEILEKYAPHVHENLPGYDYELGSIPYLYSLIPMSQMSHKPIFQLDSNDGVVGAHFSKISDFEEVIKKIAANMEKNCEALDDYLAN